MGFQDHLFIWYYWCDGVTENCFLLVISSLQIFFSVTRLFSVSVTGVTKTQYQICEIHAKLDYIYIKNNFKSVGSIYCIRAK